MKVALWIVMLFSAMLQLSVANAAPAEQPGVVLALFKVATVGAREQLQATSSIAPGEVVEYQAVYSNPTLAPVKDVQVTLPVPSGGLEVLTAWKAPQAALASTDGKRFDAMPLVRTFVMPDGSRIARPVPLAEYRFLRWSLGDMPAGATRTVSARMQLPAVTASASTAIPSTSAQPSAR
jgi:hypothetical protein